MKILAVDPGPTESAYMVWDGNIGEFGKVPNVYMLDSIVGNREWCRQFTHCVIEQIRGYGLRVGNEVFDTCWWSGRFFDRFPGTAVMLPRKEVALHLCGTASPGDKFIRQALIERLGPPGTKKATGATYGIAGDVWSALAVAVTYWDTEQKKGAAA